MDICRYLTCTRSIQAPWICDLNTEYLSKFHLFMSIAKFFLLKCASQFQVFDVRHVVYICFWKENLAFIKLINQHNVVHQICTIEWSGLMSGSSRYMYCFLITLILGITIELFFWSEYIPTFKISQLLLLEGKEIKKDFYSTLFHNSLYFQKMCVLSRRLEYNNLNTNLVSLFSIIFFSIFF